MENKQNISLHADFYTKVQFWLSHVKQTRQRLSKAQTGSPQDEPQTHEDRQHHSKEPANWRQNNYQPDMYRVRNTHARTHTHNRGD